VGRSTLPSTLPW